MIKKILAVAIKHIVWDWDGTLLDNTQLIRNIYNQLLIQAGGQPISLERYRSTPNQSLFEMLKTQGVNTADLNKSEWDQKFFDCYERDIHTCALHKEAVNILKEVLQNHRRQSILSFHPNESLQKIVKHHEITGLFTHIYGREDLSETEKINLGRRLLDKLNIPNDQIILIGDTLQDARTAKALGIRCLLIDHGQQNQQLLEKTGNAVIHNLAEVPVYLNSITGQHQQENTAIKTAQVPGRTHPNGSPTRELVPVI